MKSVKYFALRFVCYAILLLGISKIIEIDMGLQSFKESSNTEHAQDFLLFISFMLSFFIGYRFKKIREFSFSLAALLLVSFIREMDAVFDQLFHGAWVYPAILVILVYAVFIFKKFKTLLRQIGKLSDHISFGMLTMGILIIHVFSRLYGRKKIWKALMGEDNFIRTVKDASEEGIELLGYSIIFIGVIELCLYTISKSKNN